MTRLPPSFFQRDTLQVAKDLLGHRLVRIDGGRRQSGLIVETEAYIGEDDLACHAARGRTPRTSVMYGPPGRSYVYFVYGMYHCLNVVTEREDFPAAVLVRALEPQEGWDAMRRRRAGRPDRELTNGPGKLCLALGIDTSLNDVDLTADDRLHLEHGEPVPPEHIAASPRVGLNVPGWAAEVPWRVFVAGNPFVSGYRSGSRKGRDRS